MSEDEFGEAVREAREHRGWSQEFLAARVGATQSTIDRIESGQTRRSRILPEIAAVLDLELPGAPRVSQKTQSPSGLVKVFYVLPAELLQRLEQYKNDIGVSSDDEAVRRLIDDALKHRDNFVSITDRLIAKLESLKSLREAVGYVLANHPLVKSINFSDKSVTFVLKNNYSIEVFDSGTAEVTDDDGNWYKFPKDTAPKWASKINREQSWAPTDDVPF